MKRSDMTPEQREKARAYAREWVRQKYATSKEYREARRKEQQRPAAKEASRLRAARRRADPVCREKMNARSLQSAKDARRDPARWPRFVLYGLKKRAADEKLPFNIDASDVTIPSVCPVFRVPFVFGFNHPLSPSVDRVRPALGYVKGNVRVISRRANAMKQDATSLAEVLAVARYMQREGLS